MAAIVRAFWVNIRTQPPLHQAPARRQHAAAEDGQGLYDTLCGFMFTAEAPPLPAELDGSCWRSGCPQ